MKKINLVAFILLVISSCAAQKSRNDFEWKAIELPASNSDKRILLKSVNDNVIKGFEKMANDMGNEEIYNSFHVADLNSDKENDIIFNGYGGAADEFVMILLKTGQTYVKALQAYGHILRIEMKKSSSEIDIYNPIKVGQESSDTTNTYLIVGQKVTRVKSVQGKP